MNVLSLFDGMSCGQIALKQLGIIPDIYYASEIDKHAISQTQLNFPDTIQLGSVTDVDVSKLEPIDLLIGGSPCQSFSFAGKRIGMKTVTNEEIYTLDRYIELKSEGFRFEGQSYLFWEYMRILTDIRKYNPDVLFLLENVEMGKKWERVLSEAIGIYGVHINSSLVSAQNRRRIYWTNIRTKQKGLFGEVYTDIPQPEDKGIFLRDILENEVDEKYYVSQAVLDRMNRKNYSNPSVNPDKAGSLNTKNNSGQMSLDSGTTFISVDGKAPTQRSATGRSLDRKHNYQFIKLNIEGKVSPNQNKSSCFTAGAQSGGYHSDMDLICVAMRGREACLTPKRTEYGKAIRKDYEAGRIEEKRRNIQRLEPRSDGKTNCLTSIQKDNLILQRARGNNTGGIFEDKTPTLSEQNNLLFTKKIIQLNPSTDSGGVQPYQQDRVYDVNGISPALCAGHGGMSPNINIGLIRRLTPIECSRLQTVPDWYIWKCSDTQIYKMLGNGWTVDVIAHILSFMNIDNNDIKN